MARTGPPSGPSSGSPYGGGPPNGRPPNLKPQNAVIEEETFTSRFEDLLTSVARGAAILGGLVVLLCLAGIVVLVGRAAGSPELAAKVAQNVAPLQKGLTGGLVLFLAGTAALFWSQEVMLIGHTLLALGLWFAPLYAPALMGGVGNKGVGAGISALQGAGSVYGGLLMLVVLAEVVARVRNRLLHGAKADTLQYGKGIKEEADRKNVLMGACWQLPFCRKFVREKCPIYHARRTCWRELTGCMCEEVVIRGAMENRPIPKDLVAAGKMIPRNHKLTDAQKRSRCKSCVIYNEHQRHKYRVALPVLLLGFVGVYAAFRPLLVAAVSRALGQANDTVNSVLIGKSQLQVPSLFIEFLVVGLLLVAVSYAIRMLEYALFKLKI